MQKTRITLMFLSLLCITSVFAQRKEERQKVVQHVYEKTYNQFQSNQARITDAQVNVYMKPLVAEVEIIKHPNLGEGMRSEIVKIPTQMAINNLGNDPQKWRSYALFQVTKLWSCDVVVAPIFNIEYDELRGDTDVSVEVKGLAGKYKNWHSATPADYDWMRIDKSYANDAGVSASLKTVK